MSSLDEDERVVVVTVMRKGMIADLKVFQDAHDGGVYYHQKLEEENELAERSEAPWEKGSDCTVQLFHAEVI